MEGRVLVAQPVVLRILLGTLQAAHCRALTPTGSPAASRWPWFYPPHSSGWALLGPRLSLSWCLSCPRSWENLWFHTTKSNFLPRMVSVLGFFFLGRLSGTSSVKHKEQKRLPKILCREQFFQKGTFTREDPFPLFFGSSQHLQMKGEKIRGWQSQREPTAWH